MVAVIGLLITYSILPSGATDPERLKERCIRAGNNWINQHKLQAQENERKLQKMCKNDLNQCPLELREEVFGHRQKVHEVISQQMMLNLMNASEAMRSIEKGLIRCGFGPTANDIRAEAARFKFRVPTTIEYSVEINATDH